jgi:tetratricopeptide (TPR) repeat protein
MNTDAKDVVFDTCPVCGNKAFEGTPTCGCDKRFNMSDYHSIVLAARAELDRARSFFVTGRYSEADASCVRAYNLWDGLFEDSTALRIRIATESTQFDRAYELLPSIERSDLRQSLENRLNEVVFRDSAAKEHFNIALRSARRSEFRYSVDELLKAIDLAPYLSSPYRLLIKVYLEIGEQDNARIWYEFAKNRIANDSSIAAIEQAVYAVSQQKTSGIQELLLKLENSATTRLLTSAILFALIIASWIFALASGR